MPHFISQFLAHLLWTSFTLVNFMCNHIQQYSASMNSSSLNPFGSFVPVTFFWVLFIPKITSFRLWYPSSLDFMQNLSNGNERSILAVTEGCQVPALC